MISATLRKGVLRTAFVSVRCCQFQPNVCNSRKSLILWNQIQQQVLLSSSVVELNSVLQNLASSSTDDRDVFSSIGRTICDRVGELIHEYSIPELLEAAKSVPAGSLDVLTKHLVNKFTLETNELVKLCSVLAARCSDSFVYDFSCLQTYFDNDALGSSLSPHDYVRLLDSAITVSERCRSLDVSKLASGSCRQPVALEHDPNNQLRMLRMLCRASALCGTSVQAELWDQVCSSLRRSVYQMQPLSWLLVLQCLQTKDPVGVHADLAAACCDLLVKHVSKLSLKQICELVGNKHAVGVMAAVSPELRRRLGSADIDALMDILCLLVNGGGLTNADVALASARLKQQGVAWNALMRLLTLLKEHSQLVSIDVGLLVSAVGMCLWKHGNSPVDTVSSASAVIHFVHETDCLAPANLMSRCLDRLLEDEDNIVDRLPSLLTGLRVLERLDGSAFSAAADRVDALASRVSLSPSVFSPALLARLIEYFRALRHDLGPWLRDCASYVSCSVADMFSTNDLRLLADLAELLVQRDVNVPTLAGAVCHFLADKSLSTVLLSRCAGVCASQEAWVSSVSELVTLVWFCAHYSLFSANLGQLVQQYATVSAVKGMDKSVLQHLLELGLFAAAVPEIGSVMDLRAEDLCKARLRGLCCSEVSSRKMACTNSLMHSVGGSSFVAMRLFHSYDGMHFDVVIFPRSFQSLAVGGVPTLQLCKHAVLVHVVDDGLIPSCAGAWKPSQHHALCKLGYRSIAISWRHWQSHRHDDTYWKRLLQLQRISI